MFIVKDAEEYLFDMEKKLNEDARKKNFGQGGEDSLFYQKLFKSNTFCFRNGKV